VRYYADRVDLSDRAHPKVGAKINVPGLLVGGSATDPSLIYTIDYDWADEIAINTFDVVRLNGSSAKLVSKTNIAGYVGATFVSGNTAYLSAQIYDSNYENATTYLHALDLSDPTAPHDLQTTGKHGWGWLLGLAGDRAILQSGWGSSGVDIYQLQDGAAPTYDRFVRTLGWGINTLARQADTIYLTTGYWGVQAINLDVPVVTHQPR
jgi:hypothetical protein